MRPDATPTRLARLLEQWTPTEPPRRDLAERMAQWLGVRDAIALHEGHVAIDAMDANALPQRPAAWDGELQRLRTGFESAFAGDDLAVLQQAGTNFTPWHHRYLQHQRRMADSIGTLRNRLRQSMAAAALPLAQLAALDATLEQILGRREQQALGKIPVHLRARHEQLQALQAEQQRELFPPAPDAWLQAFANDFRAALAAELELRLQPLLGLIEACRDHETHAP